MCVCVCVCERESVCVCVRERERDDQPAVDHHWAFLWPVFFAHSPVEGQDGCGIVWHSMVRPGCEVKLSHFQWSL